jgi:hypothetical protein
MTDKKVHIARVDEEQPERGIQVRGSNPGAAYLGSHSGLVWINSTEKTLYFENGGSATKVFYDDLDLAPYVQKTEVDGETIGWNGSQLFAYDHSHTFDELIGAAAESHTHSPADLTGVALESHTHSPADLTGVALEVHSHSRDQLPPYYDSGWLSGSVASASHGVADLDDITNIVVQEFELSTSHRRVLTMSTPVTYYDDDEVHYDWVGWSFASHNYRVIMT